MRKKRALGLSEREASWGRREREQLREGVIAENKRILFEMFSKTKNPATIKFLDTIPESELVVNTKGLDWQRVAERYVTYFFLCAVSFYEGIQTAALFECALNLTNQDLISSAS